MRTKQWTEIPSQKPVVPFLFVFEIFDYFLFSIARTQRLAFFFLPTNLTFFFVLAFFPGPPMRLLAVGGDKLSSTIHSHLWQPEFYSLHSSSLYPLRFLHTGCRMRSEKNEALEWKRESLYWWDKLEIWWWSCFEYQKKKKNFLKFYIKEAVEKQFFFSKQIISHWELGRNSL